MQYRMILEQIKRKMQDGKVKPTRPSDNQGEMNHEQIPTKQNNKKQSK